MRSSDTLKLAQTEFLRLCGKTAGFVIDPALPSFETSIAEVTSKYHR